MQRGKRDEQQDQNGNQYEKTTHDAKHLSAARLGRTAPEAAKAQPGKRLSES